MGGAWHEYSWRNWLRVQQRLCSEGEKWWFIEFQYCEGLLLCVVWGCLVLNVSVLSSLAIISQRKRELVPHHATMYFSLCSVFLPCCECIGLWSWHFLAPRLYIFFHAQLYWARTFKKFLAFSLSDVVFIMLINVQMPTTVGILTFMSMINFMLSWVVCLIWFFRSHQQYFSYVGTGFPWLNQY